MEEAYAHLGPGDLMQPFGALVPPPADLAGMLQSTNIDMRAVAEHLDKLAHAERIAQLASLPRAVMQPWYEASFHFLPMRPTDLVPAAANAWQAVEHAGVNNLLAARRFSKVMYKTATGGVAGYNAQRWLWATGPGYFTLQWHPCEAVVDYTVLPERAPDGFPRIRSNAYGLSYFVYRGLRDTIRRVSNHVCVGHAARDGRALPNYFLITRSEQSFAAGG